MSSSKNQIKKGGTTDKIINLYKEGKSIADIAVECCVSEQTVRNKISAFTGKEKRPYNRTIRDCNEGSEFRPKSNPKIARLEMEVKDLKAQRSKFKNLYKTAQSTNTKVKGDLIILDGYKKQAEESSRIKTQEYDKLLKEHAKLKTELNRIKIEGYMTQSLRIQERTSLFKEIEDDHLFLAGKTRDGGYSKQPSYTKYLQ